MTDNVTLTKIKEFNDELNSYEYGIIVNNRKLVNLSNFDDYRTISPVDFKRFKCGVCWDYTTYEYLYFKKHFPHVKTKCFYMQQNTTDDVEPTHTWLVFYLNRKVYAFESSWGDLRGVHEFDSEDKMLKYYKLEHRNTSISDGKTITGFTIREYIPPKVFGQTPDEFMEYCLNGKVIVNHNFIIKEYDDFNIITKLNDELNKPIYDYDIS